MPPTTAPLERESPDSPSPLRPERASPASPAPHSQPPKLPNSQTIYSLLAPTRQNPAQLAASLGIPLPSDPHSLRIFNQTLSLLAIKAAHSVHEHLLHILDHARPETARRAALTILSLATALPKPTRQPKSAPHTDRALQWLSANLATPTPAKTILAAGIAQGFCPTTIRHAKSALHIPSQHTRTGWLWLPPSDRTTLPAAPAKPAPSPSHHLAKNSGKNPQNPPTPDRTILPPSSPKPTPPQSHHLAGAAPKIAPIAHLPTLQPPQPRPSAPADRTTLPAVPAKPNPSTSQHLAPISGKNPPNPPIPDRTTLPPPPVKPTPPQSQHLAPLSNSQTPKPSNAPKPPPSPKHLLCVAINTLFEELSTGPKPASYFQLLSAGSKLPFHYFLAAQDLLKIPTQNPGPHEIWSLPKRQSPALPVGSSSNPSTISKIAPIQSLPKPPP